MRQLMSVLIDTQRYQMEMLSGNVIMLENNIRLISISHTFHILLGGFPSLFACQFVFGRRSQ